MKNQIAKTKRYGQRLKAKKKHPKAKGVLTKIQTIF